MHMYDFDEEILPEEAKAWQRRSDKYLKPLRYVLIAAAVILPLIVIAKLYLPHSGTPGIQDAPAAGPVLNTANLDAVRNAPCVGDYCAKK